MSKFYSYYAILIGTICVYFLVRTAIFPQNILLHNAIIQGALIGFGLAFVSAQTYARIKVKKVNGWFSDPNSPYPWSEKLMARFHVQEKMDRIK